MDYKNTKDRMDKTISVLREELSIIRAGRANPRLLDKVTVEYYGSPTPINQVANISIPEARQIVIQPWDPKCPILKGHSWRKFGLKSKQWRKQIR